MALADGQLDPAFNGTGYHVGTVAEGTVFNNVDTRIPMVVQTNGSVVIGGSRGGFMTLARYTPTGALDTSFGAGGFATMQFAGTPTSSAGNSGATALTTDASGNIIAAGFGASQSMVAARFSANGVYQGGAVCYAPHLIDYSARAVAVKGTAVVLVGYARDRWPTTLVPAAPAVMYGQRAVVTLPLTAVPAQTSTSACGAYASNGGQSLGSANVQIDGLGHDGTPALDVVSQAGRYYEGVAPLADGRYVAVTTTGPDGAAWVERYTATGVGTLDPTFNPGGATLGRLPIANVSLHAVKLQGTDYYAAGEVISGTATGRTMLVARIGDTGGLVGGFGGGGLAQAKVGGGNDTGQALMFQGTNIIVGGGANLAGRSAFGMVRFLANGQPDSSFGAIGAGGTVSTLFGAPAVNGYITGMALSPQGFIDVSGRLTDPAGLATVAARYYATGAPPPPLPPPAASTQGIDQITTTSARITGTVNANGTAGNWWIEYGTTAGYGSQTAPQPLSASTDDVTTQGVISGLAPGTAYHARIVVGSTQGTVGGDDVVFTTLGTAVAGGGATGGTTGGATTTGGGTKTTVVKKKAKAKRCVVPKVTGKKLNKARSTVYARGCKVQVKYVKSKKATNTVLSQSRKAGKKLGFRAVVKLTVASKAKAAAKA